MSDITIDPAVPATAIEAPAGRIHEFITSRYPMVQITDDQDIFELGFINSLFAMELVMFIEKTFDLVIPTAELQRSNFSSVRAMSRLVERHQPPVTQP